MGIVIIRGPGAPLPGAVLAALVERAADAGTALAIRSCPTADDVAGALAASGRDGTAFVVVDPGPTIGHRVVVDGLRNLRVPYVEVHDDVWGEFEPHLEGDVPNRRAIVHGYAAQGYTLAMAMALEHLGRAERALDCHVGI